MSTWNRDEEKTHEHWLEVADDCGNSAIAKWDGCVHLTWQGDYIHICELDHFIEKMTALRDEARKFFGPNWPD